MANNAYTLSTDRPGLWLAGARHNHLVVGPTPERGGSGDTWLAAELLLAALTTCATAIVTDTARERGIALRQADVRASSEKDPQDKTRYAAITLTFVLDGPSQAEAEALVAAFQAACPIYATLARGAPLRTSVSVAPGRA